MNRNSRSNCLSNFPIEGECLAIADALHKAKHYVLGCNLLLATDHKPLVGVFAKNLEDIENPRLLSIADKTMWFKFTTIHVPGNLNNGPDYMSRHNGEHSDTSQDFQEATSSYEV